MIAFIAGRDCVDDRSCPLSCDTRWSIYIVQMSHVVKCDIVNIDLIKRRNHSVE